MLSVGTVAATTAPASARVVVGIGLGVPGPVFGYPAYYGYPPCDPYYCGYPAYYGGYAPAYYGGGYAWIGGRWVWRGGERFDRNDVRFRDRDDMRFHDRDDFHRGPHRDDMRGR